MFLSGFLIMYVPGCKELAGNIQLGDMSAEQRKLVYKVGLKLNMWLARVCHACGASCEHKLCQDYAFCQHAIFMTEPEERMVIPKSKDLKRAMELAKGLFMGMKATLPSPETEKELAGQEGYVSPAHFEYVADMVVRDCEGVLEALESRALEALESRT